MSHPFAVAYAARKQATKKASPGPVSFEEEMEQPGSIADRILARRMEAAPLEPEEVLDEEAPLFEEEALEPEVDPAQARKDLIRQALRR